MTAPEPTRRMTVARAVVEFLAAQHVERDGRRQRFVRGCCGIFGHGNVAGLGVALRERPEALPYYLSRNEQAMVHTAAAYARASHRLATLACTTSVGPGATNMVTAAAGATINRVPVLLLPGDVFATRSPRPVLQQLEHPGSQDVSVNDCLAPVSRYFDRINRPEQLLTALPEALRVLTDPAETGAVTLALPQDVQAEAFDVPEALLAERTWHVPRPRPEPAALDRAVERIRASERPLIVAGGGVLYSEASEALRALVEATGMPVAVTQAGKSALPAADPRNLGALGVTGTPGANAVARSADVVVGVGTRYSDFTTASQTLFAHPDVAFVGVNVAGSDAAKLSGIPVVADARAALEDLAGALAGWRAPAELADEVARHRAAWAEEVDRAHHRGHGPPPSQPEVIGAVGEAAGESGIVVCAAGSMPGELHRLWRAGEPGTYHVEYGYSCMGYEIPGGIGCKLARPDRDVFVLVGDGSYLMMPGELAVAVQEELDLTVVLVDNHGFASIGALSESVGAERFGTRYRRRDGADYAGAPLPVDLAANAESLGARVWRAKTIGDVRDALAEARRVGGVGVVHVEVDPAVPAPGDDAAWWDVPVAGESDLAGVRAARERYERHLPAQRHHLEVPR